MGSRWRRPVVLPSALQELTRVQAADNGWGNGEPNLLGVSSLDIGRFQGEHRRVQAWLYDSLNRGMLAERLQTLVVLPALMEDWYFSWALLRQGSRLTDMLTELVLVRSALPPHLPMLYLLANCTHRLCLRGQALWYLHAACDARHVATKPVSVCVCVFAGGVTGRPGQPATGQSVARGTRRARAQGRDNELVTKDARCIL